MTSKQRLEGVDARSLPPPVWLCGVLCVTDGPLLPAPQLALRRDLGSRLGDKMAPQMSPRGLPASCLSLQQQRDFSRPLLSRWPSSARPQGPHHHLHLGVRDKAQVLCTPLQSLGKSGPRSLPTLSAMLPNEPVLPPKVPSRSPPLRGVQLPPVQERKSRSTRSYPFFQKGALGPTEETRPASRPVPLSPEHRSAIRGYPQPQDQLSGS